MAADEDVLREILREGRLAPTAFMVAFNEFVCEHVPDHPIAVQKTILAYNELLEYIPEGYRISFEELQHETNAGYHRPALSVPLYEILTDVGEAIYNFFGTFFHKELRDAGLFKELRDQVTKNENAASGATTVDRILGRKEVINVYEYDAEPAELIRLYLRHTPFYELFHTQVAFRIPRKTWSSHGIVLAPSGHGKTQLLGAFIAGFLEDDTSPGQFVLDPHGDLFDVLRQRVDSSRLVVINPDVAPPALNFLDFGNSTEAQTLQTFSYLMSSLSGGLSDKQGAIVPYLLKLLRQIGRSEPVSVETLRLLVDEKVKRAGDSKYASAISALPTVDQGFFHNQFYSGRMQETKDAIGWKLYAALSSEAFRRMFGAKYNGVNFDRLMADGKVVVVKGGFDSLGEEGMRVFLQFLVAQYYAAGMRRLRLPERERHLNLFICDEASHILTTPIVARMLFDLRKVNCATLYATQVWEQVATDVKAAVLGNTAIKIVGPVQHNDAAVLSREMYCDIDFIRSMQRGESDHFAPWAMYVNGMTKKAARVTVPFFALERMPKVNDRGAYTFSDEPWNSLTQRDDTIRESPSQPALEETGMPETSETLPRDPGIQPRHSGIAREPHSGDDDHIRPVRE